MFFGFFSSEVSEMSVYSATKMTFDMESYLNLSSSMYGLGFLPCSNINLCFQSSRALSNCLNLV